MCSSKDGGTGELGEVVEIIIDGNDVRGRKEVLGDNVADFAFGWSIQNSHRLQGA